jgi:hypothetical protein
MENPEQTWMGRIQLFLRPTKGVHTASTIGLHSSFSEYGYAASENTPIDEYDTTCLSRNGTDPMANPIGMPCRKYSSTKSKKLFWSFRESSIKPFDAPSSWSGTGSSKLKLECPISDAAWLEGELGSVVLCFRLCSRMLLCMVALVFAFPLVGDSAGL